MFVHCMGMGCRFDPKGGSPRVSKQKLKQQASRASRKKAGSVHSVESVIMRFMLKDATIHDFLTGLRTTSKNESTRSRKKTRAAFARIIQQAAQKRQRQLSERGQS